MTLVADQIKNGAPALGATGDKGVYVLVNQAGEVVRSGRGNLAQRFAAHKREFKALALDYRIVAYADDYNQMRGLEAVLYDAFVGTATVANGGLNRIGALAADHPFANFFQSLAVEILK